MIVLLGPQRFRPTLAATIRSLGVGGGPLAVVTAGWQERERENDELREHVGCEVVDLMLYHRHDDVLVRDAELAEALRGRQQQLQELQDLYRLRLGFVLEAARRLMALERGGRLLEAERRAAIHAVRTLDRQHLRRIRGLHERFDARWRPQDRAAVARHRRDVAATLARSAALCIAGGHVAVLGNRLRLFDVGSLVEGKPVIAWSAGAMVVTSRIVLFHDSPPQGRGDAEVLDVGLGLCRGVVPLPGAQRRLQLQDTARVALFARRFAPDLCVVLDPGRLDWDGSAWTAEPGTPILGREGRLRELAAS